MKKIKLLNQLLCILSLNAFSQTPLVDNLAVSSNTSYTLTPGVYNLPDAGLPGLINISSKSNMTVDATGVIVNGSGFNGYVIYINNSNNITIKNFLGSGNYKYAVFAQNSRNITINGCTFSNNKKDTLGWLTISDNETTANGGGVYMLNCRNSDIFMNTMKNQNDGVALYSCDTIRVHDNDLSHNTAYGVRMFHTNYCTIDNNNCSYVNRYTDPSDCAAILLYFSRQNLVKNNNASYGGDGLFTNDNITMANSIPNFTANNTFLNNNCSHSPHNAIESVFTYGNVFKHNIASNSDYGIWAGYAQNTIIDSNTVEFNGSGIDIEMGRNNKITSNKINNSSNYGIHLRYDYIPGAPFANYDSRDNLIKSNIMNYNGTGISFSNTYNTKIISNVIRRGLIGITFETSNLANNLTVNDTIINDSLKSNASFNIQNLSPNNVIAKNNYYGTNDTNVIKCKIYDVEDDITKGRVFWKPFLAANGANSPETVPPADLAEQDWSNWSVTASDGQPTSWYYDATDKIARFNSLHITTASGFAVKAYYYPSADKDIAWNLNIFDTMYISVKAINTNNGNFQQNYIELGDGCGNYYRYEPGTNDFFTPATAGGGTWISYKIPLAGNALFPRTSFGNPSLANISYAYVMTDTWGYGFQEWIDGFSFTTDGFALVNKAQVKAGQKIKLYPNPNSTGIVNYSIEGADEYSCTVTDLTGKLLQSGKLNAKNNKIAMSHFEKGMYFISLSNDNYKQTDRIILSE